MKKYIGILLVFMFSLLSAPVIAESTNTVGDAASTVKAVNSTVETVAANVEGVNKNLVFVTDKLESAITAMSTKLGVASDKVWEILVYKHVINGYFFLLLGLLTIFLWAFSIYYFNLHSKRETIYEKERAASNNYPPYYWDNKAQIIVMIVLLALFTISITGSFLCCASDGFMDLLRPEVGAMDDALRLIRSVLQ